LKLRFKDKDGKKLAYTLTEVHWLCQGFGRNFRKLPEGIVIPEVLRPYCGFDIIKINI
jgi:seryl-tRNA synthetase